MNEMFKSLEIRVDNLDRLIRDLKYAKLHCDGKYVAIASFYCYGEQTVYVRYPRSVQPSIWQRIYMFLDRLMFGWLFNER